MLARLLAACLLALLAPAASAHDRAWINGRWFDGERFVPRTVYTVGGRLTLQPPAAPLPTEDLRGGFVVPPYGDAHHHGIDGPAGLDEKIATFLRQGIYYVKNPNVIPDFLDAGVRARINRPDSIDVAFANGGLTGTGAHPGPLHRTLAARGVFSGLSAQAMEGRAYFTVDTVAQLDAKWPSILAGRPDFIKTYLNGDHRLEHPGHGHASEAGLTPAVLRAVVERAHRAGLRVSTHVDTAGDFGVAVRAGVDEVNHLPLANPKVPGSLSATAIDWADAAAAGRRGMVVVLTANVIPRFHGARWDAADHARVAANQRANIRRLRAAGVPLAIGSDGISGERPFVTALDEVRYLSERGLVSNLELLQMWTQATAATIFPTRRIGRLDEGYEADFLVLAGDPTEDAAHLQRIVRRVKAGRTLLLPQGR